jgi:hypothetical protein
MHIASQLCTSVAFSQFKMFAMYGLVIKQGVGCLEPLVAGPAI